MKTLVYAVVLGLALSGTGVAEPPFYTDKTRLMVYAGEQGELRPVVSVADWQRRRADIVANMQLVMGPLPDESRKPPLDLEVVGEEDFPAFVRKKVFFAVEDWDRLPAYLLVPKGLRAKAPAMLCLHPTSVLGKGMVVGLGDKPHRNYAEELAARGYITLAPDYPGFGGYVETRKALYAHGYVSCTMKGIWNHRRCIDLLESLPEVDPERIGCIGHSLGGHNTLFAGVFDERIRVMVTSCGFNAFPKYYAGNVTGWTHDGYMPRIATVYGKDPARLPFDFPGILGALAPRPVFISASLYDANFEVSGVRDCVRAAKPVYALYGAEKHLAAVYPDAEHDFPDAAREAAYAFIDKVLRAK